MEPSPYLPTSRRFVNPLYLRVEAIPEFAYVRDRGRIRKARSSCRPAPSEARADRPRRRVDGQARRAASGLPGATGRRAASWRTPPTAPARGAAWTTSPSGARWPRSTAATGTSGPRRCSTRPPTPWPRSPPNTPTPSTFTAGCSGSSTTSSRPHSRPRSRRACLSASCTTWRSGWTRTAPTRGRCRTCWPSASRVGAPPDEFNQLGQDWSQPPWRPDQLVAQAYEPFRALVNAVLRHAGGMRIDHIIGLFRLWWIPKGSPPTEGTYVRYDHEAMIGIVALEAHRAGAVVVGEDLGTVEPWARDYLRERGLLGTSILWFELDRDGDGGPLQAQRWREYCLSAVTTHDLPPTAGYLAGEHVRLREQLGLLTRPVDEELAGDRAATVRMAGRTAPGRPTRRRPRWSRSWRRSTSTSAAPRRSCWRCRWPTRWAICGPRISRAPPTNTRTGGFPDRRPTAGSCCSRTCSVTGGRPRWPRSCGPR